MNVPRKHALLVGGVLGIIMGVASGSWQIGVACFAISLVASFGGPNWGKLRFFVWLGLMIVLMIITLIKFNDRDNSVKTEQVPVSEQDSDPEPEATLGNATSDASRSAEPNEGIGGGGVSDAELMSEPGAEYVEFMITSADGEAVIDTCTRGTYDFEFMLEAMFNYEFEPAESMLHDGGTVYCKYENLAFVAPDLGDVVDSSALPLGFNENPDFPIAVTIEGVPGGLQQDSVDPGVLMDGPPQAWVPDNQAPENVWIHPFVTAGFAPDSDSVATVYTNHVSFNQESDSEYEVTFYYGMWLYENGDLGETIVHSTYHQLLWLWGSDDGQPGHDGIGWWGPVPVDGEESLSWVDVTYRDRDGNVLSTCSGHSFEVVPNTFIELSFVNEGDTSAVWGQGPWGLNSGFGIIEPDCSP